MKNLLLAFLIAVLTACQAEEAEHTEQDKVASNRYELYKTENVYTQLLLDTRTGRVWQTQYALTGKQFEGAIAIPNYLLAEENGPNGRFSLLSTGNMFTFLLFDKTNGSLQHCQFSLDTHNAPRACYGIVASREKDKESNTA